MTHFSGGNTSSMHPAFFTTLVNQTARVRMGIPPLEVVADIVHEVASVPATASQMEQVIELLQGIHDDAAADRAAPALERTPYSPLRRLLPENKEQLLIYIEILLFILGMVHMQILSTQQQPHPIDEQRIVREVNERIDQRIDEMEKELEKEKEKDSDHKPPHRKHR
jgi:hypothetical protein